MLSVRVESNDMVGTLGQGVVYSGLKGRALAEIDGVTATCAPALAAIDRVSSFEQSSTTTTCSKCAIASRNVVAITEPSLYAGITTQSRGRPVSLILVEACTFAAGGLNPAMGYLTRFAQTATRDRGS